MSKKKNVEKHNNNGDIWKNINKIEKVNSNNGFSSNLGNNDGNIMIKNLFFSIRKTLIIFSNELLKFLPYINIIIT